MSFWVHRRSSLLWQKKKESTAESALRGQALFDASRPGEKELKYSRDKTARHEPQWGGGEESLLCDPRSGLRPLILVGRENKKGEDK